MTLDPARIHERAQVLLAAAREAGFPVTADLRIGLKDAATLIGRSHGDMRRLQGEGKGPRIYRLGFGKHRITVNLVDFAEWIELHRD